jgi:hypothetical protein
MTVAEVESYLADIADQPLKWILLFGGEPFVCYDLLRASVKLASQKAGVLVFTNGYWAIEPETARRLLAGLQEVGLDYVLFSVDAFHQAHVPLERIAIGIEAARALGYGQIEIDNRCLGGPDAHNPFNQRTRENMTRLAERCDLTGVTISQGPSRLVGRAADELSSHLAPQAIPSKCPLPDYLGDDIRSLHAVEIHPGGRVNLCAGIALGNTRERPLRTILTDCDPEAHPIISVLVQEGPAGLLQLARRHGYAPAGDCVDSCHLCYQVRRFLHPYYPEYLAPAWPYEAG